MGFGYCMDCRHWQSPEGDIGICKILDLHHGAIEIVEEDTSRNLTTWDGFGCPYSEEKPKGPFDVCTDADGWYARFKPSRQAIGYMKGQVEAERACEILNKLWERRE